MNVNLLIDAVVRQTTILIAQLATAAGARATLAHTANQVFADLVDELKAQGLGNKVIADMFGLTLRTYHHKVARLSESTTERGRSLWEALLEFVQARPTVLRSDVLAHFSNDDELKVRGVLQDLVDSGLVFRSGRGDETLFRAAAVDEYAFSEGKSAAERLENFVWIAVYRRGPSTRAELREVVPAPDAAVDDALASLERDGRIHRLPETDPVRYASRECVIEIGDPTGWEAAVFDHYQAVVTAISSKLQLGKRRATVGEWIGGSTYGFEVWDDHPHRAEVLGFLQETRERAVRLRQRVATFNAANTPGDGVLDVIAYVGQTVRGYEDPDTNGGLA
ncbi:MAG TPA: hypothetical protein VHE30_17765 [Polyangiaceae bacterium]|nr:hypothetical protein [Polyangiaceae bacterium]